MTKIPVAREILRSALAMDDIDDVKAAIRSALGMMTRVIENPNGRTISDKVDRAKVLLVLKLIRQNPDATNKEIGNMANIDGGRVCEIRRGQRTPDKPGMSGDGLNVEIAERMGR